MGTRFIALPNGEIEEIPDTMTNEQAYRALGIQAPSTAKPGGNGWMGDVARGVGGVLSGAGQLLQDTNNPAIQAARAIPGVDVAIGAIEAARPYTRGAGQALKQRGDEMQANNPATINSWRDIHGVGDLGTFTKETVLSSAPMLAGGILTGSPMSMFAMSALPTYAQIRDQQKKTGVDDVPGALLASTASGALDMELGVGGAVQRAMGRRVVEGAADGFLKSVGKTTLSEGFTEGLQQVVQRAGGHQELTSPEAYDEYITNALGGALAGGVTGTALHPFTKTRNAGQQDDGVDIPPPVDPSGPTDLLRLPAPSTPSGPTMFVNQHGEAGQSLGEVDAFDEARNNAPVPDMRTPAMDAAPIGSQANMFSPVPTYPEEAAPERTDQGGQKVTPLPDPLQPSLFDNSPTALTRTGFGPREIRMALTGGAKPDPFVHKLGAVLSRSFAEGDIDTARKTVERELDKLTTAKVTPETIDHRLQVLDRAHNLVETYNHAFLRDAAEEGTIKAQPGAVVGAPISKDGAIEQALEQNTQSKAEEPKVRQQLLEKTVATPDIRDPVAYFQAQLKRNGLDPVVSDQEFDHLYRAMEAEQATQNELDARAANNGVAPIEAEITPQRKRDVAAALNEPDVVRAKLNEAAKPATKEQAKPDEKGVTKVAPGNARGLETRNVTPVAAEQPEEQAGELTQEQVDQQETYARIGEARAKNQIDDHEQALLTNMIRGGASNDIVRQAITDLTQQRKRTGRKIRERALTGKMTPREANIALAENTPRDARFPGKGETTPAPTPNLAETVKSGALLDALKLIATEDTNPIRRIIAQALVRAKHDTPMTVVPADTFSDNTQAITHVDTNGKIEIEVSEKAINSPEFVLHEALHSFLLERFGTFDRGLSTDEWMTLPQPVRQALSELSRLQVKLRRLLKKGPLEVRQSVWAAETTRLQDELMTYVLTSDTAQRYLDTVDIEGNPIKVGKQSAWAKVVDLLRRIFGLAPTVPTRSMLTELMRPMGTIIENGVVTTPDGRLLKLQVSRQMAAKLDRAVYAGPEAKDETGDHAKTLAQAKEMLASGMDPAIVNLNTGWWKNPFDNKWRREISDGAARWNMGMWTNLPENKPLSQPSERHGVLLSDILDHPKLFKAYPDLASIMVAKAKPLFDIFKSTQGWFNEDTGVLVVTPHAKDPLSTALHEIQHAIQSIENTARGGNQDMSVELLNATQRERKISELKALFEQKIEELNKQWNRLLEVSRMPEARAFQMAVVHDNLTWDDLQQFEKRHDTNGLWSENYGLSDKLYEEYEALRAAWRARRLELEATQDALMSKVFGHPRYFDLTDDQQTGWVRLRGSLIEGNIDRDLNKISAEADRYESLTEMINEEPDGKNANDILRKELGFKLYEAIAGEIEARDVQARQYWSPQMRRETPPLSSENFDSRDVLVHYGDNPQASMSLAAKEEGAPPKFIEPRHLVADALQGKLTRGAALFALGNKLTEMAQKAGVKTAQAYQRLLDERRAISSKVEAAYVDLSEDFDRLAAPLRGRGKGTLNALAKRSVFSGRWAFQPDWLKDSKGNPIQVTVDPELNAEYLALPADARKVFNDMLRVPHETLHRKRKAVTDLIEGEHGVLVKAAQEKHDAAVAAGANQTIIDEVARELRNARKHREMDLQQFGRLFNVNLHEPYMPIRRFGDYVVVARSPEYLAEEQKARITGDDEKLEKMKAEPQHYFVDFAETNEAAGRMKRILVNQFGKDNVEKFTKDKAKETLLGGRDMFHAFERLRKVIDDTVPGAQKGKLDKMVTDLLLSTLIQTSSRKAEMARLKVNGGNFDMMRGAISQGRADAGFIGAIHKNHEIVNALSKMREEAAFQDGERDAEGREERQSLVNEIMLRHAMSMAPPPPNALADKATALTSTYMLTTSPSFYVQQITQPLVMSVPWSAARHGYVKSIAALRQGYKRVAEAWAGTGATGSLDLDKLPEDMRPFAYWLAERGRLDVGINKEMGSWSSDGRGGISDAVHSVTHKLSALTRKFEAINRLSTGVMEFTLQNQSARITPIHDADAYASYVRDTKEAHPDMKPMTEREFAAANHALKLIDDTHGNYDMANAPRFMRGPVGRVLTQFKKFQIMQVQLYAQAIKDGFFGENTPPEERAIARKALAYMTGHAAIMAGTLGLPAVTSLVWLFEALFSGNDEPPDAERDIRKAIGNPALADLLLHGAPTLAGLNLTGSIGQGNILSLAPYADSPLADNPKDAGPKYSQYVVALLGPMIGGIGPQMAEGLSFMSKGELYKGFEKMMPRGLNAAMRSYREATQGETNRAGEVTEPDIGARETIYSALGLQPIERTTRQFRRQQFYNDSDFYDGKATDLRKAYADAAPAERPALRTQWKELQDLRVEHGFKRQPMSSLMHMEKANRKKLTEGGLVYTKSQKNRVEQLDDLTGYEDNSEE